MVLTLVQEVVKNSLMLSELLKAGLSSQCLWGQQCCYTLRPWYIDTAQMSIPFFINDILDVHCAVMEAWEICRLYLDPMLGS